MRLLLTTIFALVGFTYLQADSYVEVVHVKHRRCHSHHCHSHHYHHHYHSHSRGCCHKHYYYDSHCGGHCHPRHRVHVHPSFGFGIGFSVHP